VTAQICSQTRDYDGYDSDCRAQRSSDSCNSRANVWGQEFCKWRDAPIETDAPTDAQTDAPTDASTDAPTDSPANGQEEEE